MKNENISLSKISFYNTIISILVFAIALAYFIYMFSDNLYNKRVVSLEENFYHQNKRLAKREVEKMVERINLIKENTYRESREILVQKVSSVKNLFNNIQTDDDIKKLLITYSLVLDKMKWDNSTGYIYIFNNEGIMLYHGADKTKIGKNVFDLAKSNKELAKFIDESMKQDEYYGTYTWQKPDYKDDILFKKFTYTKQDKKHQIFIAAGIYESEINKRILNKIRQDIYHNRFGENRYGYFWIHGLDLKMKVHPIIKTLENVDLTTTINAHTFEKMNLRAKEGGGFVKYNWQIPDSIKVDKKVSFVKLIDEMDLVLGSGFYLSELNNILKKEKQNLRDSTNDFILETLFIIAIMLIIVIIVSKFISYKIKEIETRIVENVNMLRQYRLVLDKSSVVSKTNKDGIITYVNDKFCKVSGYTKEQSINSNHNIIRHPDSEEEQFKDLWETIQKGEIWKGIIKNKSKKGDAYFNNITIVPIKNSKGEILEYISSGTNITALFDLHKEIEDTQKEVIYKMGEIGETRSKETGNHVKRVAEYSRLLALLYGLDKETANILFTASPMHDIGKVGISDSILKKPGKLTDEEFEVMKTHAEIGYSILKGSKREVLKAAAIVAHEHQEKYDGTGYPQGLKAEEIHIFGRITAIADVFDALGSDRCYKKAWSDDKIFNLFREDKGQHFDPKLMDLFFKNIDDFLEIRNKFKN